MSGQMGILNMTVFKEEKKNSYSDNAGSPALEQFCVVNYFANLYRAAASFSTHIC